MGDVFGNVRSFDEGHAYDGPAECNGDGHIDYYGCLVGTYRFTIACSKEPRDCQSCCHYVKEKWDEKLERMTYEEGKKGMEEFDRLTRGKVVLKSALRR